MNAKKDAKTLLKVLFEKQFHPAHIKMTESIGLVPALVLQQHIWLQSEKGPEYNGIRNLIKKQFRLSIKIQRSIEKKLIKINFLSLYSKPKSSFHYYTVNTNEVKKFINLDYETRIAITDQVFNYTPIQEPITDEGGSDKREAGVVTKGKHLIHNNNKVSSKEDTADQNSAVEELPKKPSRLLPKTDIVETRKKSKSPVERTNIATGNTKPVSKQTIKCIEYWNSYPELATHVLKWKIKEEIPKTARVIESLLAKFFNGTLLDVASIPKGFKDYNWFKKPATFDDFCDVVDDFIYCIRSPEVRPVNNGIRYNLATFLKGNEFINTKNGGTPSLMLNYCFGDYKTVIIDENPRSTMRIKEMWNEYIGKYKDTPATEKAFILASNLCVERYHEKREEIQGWTPAMGELNADGIVKQILINKKDWFKKEKKSPEIMSGSYFTNIIRRYDYDDYTGEKTI